LGSTANITLSGEGSVAIDGSYSACDNDTDWSGGGDLTAEVEVGGMVKAKVLEVIVLEGAIKGSTSITEKLSIDLAGLKLTTSWGGLTGSGLVTIEIPQFGPPMIFEVSKTYFEKSNLLPVTIPLPSLKQE